MLLLLPDDGSPKSYNKVFIKAGVAIVSKLKLTKSGIHPLSGKALKSIIASSYKLIVIVADPEQPPISVATTVYIVVVFGEAFTVDPVAGLRVEAGLQTYCDAPDAVRIVEPPGHIISAEAETLTFKKLLTVTVIICDEVHPASEVPVTVYVVVEDGVTITGLPDILPGIQV